MKPDCRDLPVGRRTENREASPEMRRAPLSLVGLCIQNDPAELSRVLERLEESGRANGGPERTHRSVAVPWHERVMNILNHGCEDARQHGISVCLEVGDSGLQVEVEDVCRPINPPDHRPADPRAPLDEGPVGGLGVQMMRLLLDEMDCRRVGDRNRLTLRQGFA